MSLERKRSPFSVSSSTYSRAFLERSPSYAGFPSICKISVSVLLDLLLLVLYFSLYLAVPVADITLPYQHSIPRVREQGTGRKGKNFQILKILKKNLVTLVLFQINLLKKLGTGSNSSNGS